MDRPAPQRIEVDHAGKVGIAQQAARSFAQTVRFAEVECDQIAIVVSELATNLIRHARGGVIRVALARDGEHVEDDATVVVVRNTANGQ